MILRYSSIALGVLIASLGGCSTPPKSASSQVQVNFTFTPPEDSGAAKHVTRGAISGLPQHVGFYYSVNPDCSSDGLVQLHLKNPPAHGSVTFVNDDGYTNFPAASPAHECNAKKSPGVRVVYTSVKDFVGTDQFTVQGIGPHGKYLESDYAVKVIAP
jgi:hypothetical protein